MKEQSVSLRLTCVALTVLTLAGCASTSHRAPVENRMSTPSGGTAPAANAGAADTPKAPPPGAENAGKPGYYTVKPGDTLIRLSLDAGQNWRDIVKWNNLANPNVIEVGQALRIVPPGQDPSGVIIKPITTPAPAVAVTKLQPGTPASAAPGAVPASAAPAAAPAPAASTMAARDTDDDMVWTWPVPGAIIGNFEEGKNKGIALAGKAGDPVYAAADGHVVYAGSGVHGYGNLVIVKHNATFLTAYAHNQALLVKDEQVVKRGQKIAEMGSTEADRVELHFEIRRMGRAVDPVKLLPPR